MDLDALREIDVNSILNETFETESENPEESVDQLLERANAQTLRLEMENNVRSRKPETTQPVVILTLDETLDASDSPPSNAPISAFVESDDDVIFVGEQNVVINLCSPVTRQSRILTLNNNQNGQVSTTAKTTSTRLLNSKTNNTVPNVPTVPDPEKNTVLCAVCMDSSVGRQPHSTTCGHIFCGICIKQAIKVTKKCPLCNKTLNARNIIPVFI